MAESDSPITDRTPPSDGAPASTNGDASHAGSGASPTRVNRRFAFGRRWMRETLNREQLVAGLKQLMWVAPLTLLIWVYADREQQVPDNVRVAIDVRSSNPNVALTLIDPPPSDSSIMVNLNGPHNRIEDLRRSLGPRSEAVHIEVPADLKHGMQHLIEVRNAIGRDPRFDGVTVESTQPARASVFIDTIEERSLPVQLREAEHAKYDKVSFSPANVKVRLPAKVWGADQSGRMAVYADLSTLPDTTQGRKTDVPGIRLTLDKPDLSDTAIEPSTVSVSLTVLAASISKTIENLPLQEMGLSEPLNGVKIQFDPSLFDVVVSGPPDVIGMIGQKGVENVIKAFVEFRPTDVQKNGSISKEVNFILPAGVTVQSVKGAPVLPKKPLMIEVKIDKRNEGE